MDRETKHQMSKDIKERMDKDCQKFAAGGSAKVRKGEATAAGKQIKGKR